MTEQLRRGSTVALPTGRVGTLTRRDTQKKAPGTWWRVATLFGDVETHEEKTMQFIHQEPERRIRRIPYEPSY